MKNNKLRFNLILAVISLISVGIDQLTKWLAVTFVKPAGTIPIIKFGETEWVNFTYCENTGMSFSLLEGQRIILIGLPILLIGVVEYLIFSGKIKSTAMNVALAFLAGGGLGNLIDRIFLGYVVDFIDFTYWPVFNVADIAVVCGTILLSIMILTAKEEELPVFGKDKKKEKTKK